MGNKDSRSSLLAPMRLVFLMWLVFSIEQVTFDFGFLGILPRSLSGLIGIFAAPLIHGNVSHLMSNSVPVLFLGFLLYYFYPLIATRIFIQCYLFTGFFVWLFGRPFYHIGASGLVYGLAFFLVFLGIFKKDFKTILISIVVMVVYGGVVYNVLNISTEISFESHLLGALVGIASAYTTNKYSRHYIG
ncbi:MAG: rhomboid family intramembrane serine protease [Cyclobacteriaceae bacterium]